MDRALSQRYADPQMGRIWSDPYRWRVEREIWFAVLSAQADLGISSVTTRQMTAYRDAVRPSPSTGGHIGLFEERTRHETMAKLLAYEEEVKQQAEADQSFNQLHWGLTSADIVENAYCIQIRDSLIVIRLQAATCLQLLAKMAVDLAAVETAGRTHGQPAQITTLGARYARYTHEMLAAVGRIEDRLTLTPFRGIRGAVGNLADVVTLSDTDRAQKLDELVTAHFGWSECGPPTGQVGYRSSDLDTASALLQLCAAPASMAVTLRQMQMLGLVQEGFDEQQVGSSAMAHKRNPILCERVGGLQNVVRGYHLMLELTAGNTWFEGDVSDSSTRRVAWPGIFLATSGLLRTFHDLLSGLKHRKLAVDDELTEHETSLATGTVLSRAILAGVDRVRAHEALRQPYDKWAVALDMPADQVSDWVGGAGSGIAPEQARSVEGVT